MFLYYTWGGIISFEDILWQIKNIHEHPKTTKLKESYS